MKTWIKIVIGIIVFLIIAFGVGVGIGAYDDQQQLHKLNAEATVIASKFKGHVIKGVYEKSNYVVSFTGNSKTYISEMEYMMFYVPASVNNPVLPKTYSFIYEQKNRPYYMIEVEGPAVYDYMYHKITYNELTHYAKAYRF